MKLRQLTDAQLNGFLGNFDPARPFVSHFPPAEAYADAELDPGVLAAMDAEGIHGVPGSLQVKILSSFVAMDWVNVTRGQTYEIFNSVGVLSTTNLVDLGGIFRVMSASDYLTGNREQMIADMVDTAAAATVAALSKVPNVYVQLAAAIIAMGNALYQSITNLNNPEEKKAEELRLQNAQTETDQQQVRLAQVVMAASGNDYTALFSPRFDGNYPWVVQRRRGGWGFAPGKPEEGGNPAEFMATGGFGCIPGGKRTTSVIQVVKSQSWGKASPYCHGDISNADKAACAMHALAGIFKGQDQFDCNSCLRANSDSATAQDVGTYYATLNQTLFQLGTYIGKPSPLMYTVNGERLLGLWDTYIQSALDTVLYWWIQHEGWGWKNVVSQWISQLYYTPFANEFGIMKDVQGMGDKWRELHLEKGGGNMFEAVVEPSCVNLRARQRGYLLTTLAAYCPKHNGAQGDSTIDIVQRKRDLLTSQARFSIRMRDVTDDDFRQALIDSGVKPGNMGFGLSGNGAGPGPEPTKPKGPGEVTWGGRPTHAPGGTTQAVLSEIIPMDPGVSSVAALNIPDYVEPLGTEINVGMGPGAKGAIDPAAAIMIAGGVVAAAGAALYIAKRGGR